MTISLSDNISFWSCYLSLRVRLIWTYLIYIRSVGPCCYLWSQPYYARSSIDWSFKLLISVQTFSTLENPVAWASAKYQKVIWWQGILCSSIRVINIHVAIWSCSITNLLVYCSVPFTKGRVIWSWHKNHSVLSSVMSIIFGLWWHLF